MVIRQIMLLLRVIWDLAHGLFAFHCVGPCVTVFGSARLSHDALEYRTAHAVGAALAHNRFTVMTGGGPGLMEAASRGAHEAGGQCVACRIRLSFEQTRNNYIHRSVAFRYFFVRKVMLVRNSNAMIVLPGGLGTMDELFEVLTLIQTKKIPPMPIVFVGTIYWQPLLDVIERMVSLGTISRQEMAHVASRMLVTDDLDQVIAHIKTHCPSATRVQAKMHVESEFPPRCITE